MMMTPPVFMASPSCSHMAPAHGPRRSGVDLGRQAHLGIQRPRAAARKGRPRARCGGLTGHRVDRGVCALSAGDLLDARDEVLRG